MIKSSSLSGSSRFRISLVSSYSTSRGKKDKLNNFKSFEKNFPEKKVVKPWEKKELSKDEFFMRKYNFSTDLEKSQLKKKVERQRRAREMRKQNESSNIANKYDGNNQNSFFRNSMAEYLYGTHAVLSALAAKKRDSYSKLFVYNAKEKTQSIIKLASEYGIKILDNLTKSEINHITGNGVHNGVALETRPLDFPTVSTFKGFNAEEGTYDTVIMDDINNQQHCIQSTVARDLHDKASKFPLGIYLDGVTDPQNAGAIIRSAYYLGVDFILIPDHSTSKLGPVAAKAAAGALDLLPIYQISNPFKFVDHMKSDGWCVVTTSARPKFEELEDLKSKNKQVETTLKGRFIESGDLSAVLQESPILLVLGSEGEGVRTLMKLKSDYLVSIDPRRSQHSQIVDSLNASVACALIIEKCLE